MKARTNREEGVDRFLAHRHEKQPGRLSANAISCATNIPKREVISALKELVRQGKVQESRRPGFYVHVPGHERPTWRATGRTYVVLRIMHRDPRRWVTVRYLAGRCGYTAQQLHYACRQLADHGLLDIESRVSAGRRMLFMRATEALMDYQCDGCEECGEPLDGRHAYCLKCLPIENRAEPCDVAVGSEMKVRLLMARMEEGVPLWPEHLDPELYDVPIPGIFTSTES